MAEGGSDATRRFFMRLTKEELRAVLPLLGVAPFDPGTKSEWIDALFARVRCGRGNEQRNDLGARRVAHF